MEAYGTLESISGNELKISLDDDISLQTISRLSANEKPTVMLEIAEER